MDPKMAKFDGVLISRVRFQMQDGSDGISRAIEKLAREIDSCAKYGVDIDHADDLLQVLQKVLSKGTLERPDNFWEYNYNE